MLISELVWILANCDEDAINPYAVCGRNDNQDSGLINICKLKKDSRVVPRRLLT